MGGCSSVDSLLFPPPNSSIQQRKQKNSTYLDANFQKVKQPVQAQINEIDDKGEKGKKENQCENIYNKDREQYSKLNKMSEQFSKERIEIKAKRSLIGEQSEFLDIQAELDTQSKVQQNKKQNPKDLSNQQSQKNMQKSPQSKGKEILELKQKMKVYSNNQLSPTQQINEQCNTIKQTFLQSPQKSSVGVGFSSLSTQEQVEIIIEEDDIEDKIKIDNKQFKSIQDEMNSISQNKNQSIPDININCCSSSIQDNSCNGLYKQKQEKNQYIQNDECNRVYSINLDLLNNEKQFDESEKTYLQNRENNNLISYMNENQFFQNRQSNNIYNETHSKEEQEIEENQIQIDLKLNEIRKSFQAFNFNKNSQLNHEIENQNLHNYNSQQITYKQQTHAYPISVPSLIQEGLSKISSIHLVHTQSQNQCKREEPELSLFLSNSQNNSILNCNYLPKDSKQKQNESIISPMKMNMNGGLVSNQEAKDSDSSTKREEDQQEYLRNQKLTTDLNYLLQQDSQQEIQLNINKQNQSNDQIKKKQNTKFNKDTKLHEQIEDFEQNKKEKQNEQIDDFKYTEFERNEKESHTQFKHQSQSDEQQGMASFRKNTDSLTNRYSLKQPEMEMRQNNDSQDENNISIVVSDPRNVMKEQLVFIIQPINSKCLQNKNFSSQRVSLVSHSGEINQEKKDSALNRTMPHRSLLENTNRVIMQKYNLKKLNQPSSLRSIPSQSYNIDILNIKNIIENQIEKVQSNSSQEIINGFYEQTEDIEFSVQHYQNLKKSNSLKCNKISEIPQSEEEIAEEEFENTNLDNKNSSFRKKAISIQTNANPNLKSLSRLEQSTIQFEEELKKMKQDQIKQNLSNNGQNDTQQSNLELNNSQSPLLQMHHNNNVNDFDSIGNNFQHYESIKSFPSSHQQYVDEGNEEQTISPYLKQGQSLNSIRSSKRYFSIQSIPQNQIHIQKLIGNIQDNNSTPFHSCIETPKTSKRGSSITEPIVISQQEILQKTSEISENQRVNYFKKNSVNLNQDCDSYQIQVINSSQLQNIDLLEQPELYMEWVKSLNQMPSITLSSEAIYQFEIIKQETYQDFLSKFEQEYYYNLDLFDPIFQQQNINIYFRSELGLDQQRIFVITGEYYVNTNSYAAFYNFKNKSDIQQILNNFDFIYSLNDDLQNTVLYANYSSKYLQKPCEFVFLKHFSFLQQNIESYDYQQNGYNQLVEQMCEIDVSLNSEEIEQYLKKDKKNKSRGEVFSGNITTFIPELNQLKVEIMIEHNFHNLFNLQQAKNMYTEMFKVYFQKLNTAFP